MESIAQAALPEYRSIKKVWALKVENVIHIGLDHEYQIMFNDPSFGFRDFNLRNKPIPERGWYYVQYESGYESFSPAEEFEAGNIPKPKVLENAARLAHETNRLLCQALGDHSQPIWEEAPNWQKLSAA